MCLCDRRGTDDCETCNAIPSDYFVVSSGTIPIKIDEKGGMSLKPEQNKDEKHRRTPRQQGTKGTDKKKNKRK